ncbi:glycosyltransferase [Fictibacillus sp. 5RED26]|uniref:glycosyltransferase n=1 Tax=Fictibacillus sp. 5RED26 TaxID=2745876 RepID=UPI0018CD61DF|nr:glycosyltransferase [Fictibacillus sp. 5RED26]MBH0156612.1 glycosyltransferase [Fictibacillus sp. 5RED26]
MKILINAISAKMGGAKVILSSFLNNLPTDENEYFVLVPSGESSQVPQKNIHILQTDQSYSKHFQRFFWYQYTLPKFIEKEKFDYMINLTNYGPVNARCKQILLLHNSKHVSKEMYENYSVKNKMKLLFEDIVFRLSLKGTDILVVQTDYMKEGVIKKFKYDKRIEVIPNGSNIKTGKKNKDLEFKLTKFIGETKHIFSSITLYAKHKNLELLIEAAFILKKNFKLKFKLILTIDSNENKEAHDLIKRIEHLGLEDCVLSVGNVENENIYQILQKTTLYVFPSYAESFGLPFVEAMKFGKPIVASDIKFARDVCGSAATYFNHTSSHDLAFKIFDIINKAESLKELEKKSIERGEHFSEEVCIKQYLSLLN